MMRRRKPDPHPELHERLRGKAQPWRLQSQLSRLKDKPRRAGESFEFAVLGDAEPGRFWIWRKLFNRPGVFELQLAAIQRQSVDFSIQLGDMVSEGHPLHYERFFEQLEGVGVKKPYLTVCGNHDRSNPHGGSHSTAYRSLFGRSNYHFDYGGVRFVTLDSSRGRITRLQLKWLSMVMDSNLRKVVFTHMPPVQLQMWGGAAAHHMGGFRHNAGEFTDVMARHGVERVYMGHVHCFGVQDFKGVRYILTGGGGSPLFPCGSSDKFHHYLTVSVTAQGLRERVHSLDGSSFEIPTGKVLLPNS
jgi:3',5'-cyclic AMP phosphodiesterase CpdA